MTDIKIEVIDYTYSKIVKGLDKVFPCLSFEHNKTMPVQFGTKSVVKRKPLYNVRSFKFFTGFIPRIEQYCKINKLDLEIIDNFTEYLEPENEPYLIGKNIKTGKYDYEYDLIKEMIEQQRGVIKAATGTGKTSLILGLISAYSFSKVLFLSDTYVPLSQLEADLKEQSHINSDNITVSTVQSAYRKDPETYKDEYDIILIDECHSGFGKINKQYFTTIECMYGIVLKHCQAPIRLGFTATLPDTEIARLNLEGLLGPVIGHLSSQEGEERGVIVKPKIILTPLPKNLELRNVTWQVAYNQGIVNNRALNRKIVENAKEDIESGLTVLILVKEIEHGENILRIANDLYNLGLIFVRGSTDKDIREQIRHAMIDRNIPGVIATAVFKKALNIPNLGSVINGIQGKSESDLIQLAGRGARSSEGKDYYILRDYFNPSNRYLIEHFGYRWSTYCKKGWL